MVEHLLHMSVGVSGDHKAWPPWSWSYTELWTTCCGYWKLKSCPQHEQYIHLNTEPYLFLLLFVILFLLLFVIILCVRENMLSCYPTCVEITGQPEGISSLHHVNPGNLTQVIRFGHICLSVSYTSFAPIRVSLSFGCFSVAMIK